MYECAAVHGASHLKVFDEAMMAEHNRFSSLQPLTRRDFDRWIGEYDVFIELGSYTLAQCLDAYLPDPDVRFLLTERDPDKWVRSFDNFVGFAVTSLRSFPMNFLKYFHGTMYYMYEMNIMAYQLFSGGLFPGEEGSKEHLRKNYVEYIKAVKRDVPADRLTIIKLEDGLGWKELCAFTGDPIPSDPYPRGTEHEGMLKAFFASAIQTSMLRVAGLAAPVIGAGVWFWMHRAK